MTATLPAAILLFAQQGRQFVWNEVSIGWVGFFIGATAISAIWFGSSYAIKTRQMAHAERLKALELNVPIDQREEQARYRAGVFWISFWIGCLVPLAAIGSVTLVIQTQAVDYLLSLILWGGAAIVAVAGIVSAAWLTYSSGIRMGMVQRMSFGGAPVYEAR